MTTTTGYGTWNNHGDSDSLTVEQTVREHAGAAGDVARFERLEESGALDRTAADYRDAINDALPEGVTLIGDAFYGPYHEADRTWTGDLDISEVVGGVDLAAILERHDPDQSA